MKSYNDTVNHKILKDKYEFFKVEKKQPITSFYTAKSLYNRLNTTYHDTVARRPPKTET